MLDMPTSVKLVRSAHIIKAFNCYFFPNPRTYLYLFSMDGAARTTLTFICHNGQLGLLQRFGGVAKKPVSFIILTSQNYYKKWLTH